MDIPTGNEEKKVKITSGDLKKLETILKSELSKRQDDQFRRNHEQKWKEVDRQVALDEMTVERDAEDSWMPVFELGTLAKASEIMTADIIRVVFPEMRSWNEAHVEISPELDPKSGEEIPVNQDLQEQVDGRLRALMTQQHEDFGLRDRVEMSIKEALHHGGFVSEVVEDSMDMYFGSSIKEITSPVWKPHSMWNCWPDPSPSLVGSNMFYTGSIFIRSYMPRHEFMESAVGEGWITKNLKRIPKDEHEQKDIRTKDLEIITYYGDLVIPTGSDEVYIPNQKAILANNVLVYANDVKTPYLPIIYKTYERMDVRDPYGTSPIIKQSPMQKVTSILANEYVAGVQLSTRPPIVYDGNDPQFILDGGPRIAPGAKSPTKGSANWKSMDIGEPQAALQGLEYGVGSMKEGLGRPGIDVGDRATATEVNTKQADSESGPFGFAIKMDYALRSFLYMQHAINLQNKNFKYSYYNPEMDSPDFLRASHKDLPENVNFEVVGSKGVLGEQRRQQAFIQATALATGNPIFAPLIDPVESLKQIYMDSGIKNPERFIKKGDIPPEIQSQMKQMMGVIQQLQGELQQEKSGNQVKMANIEAHLQMNQDKINAKHITDMVNLASDQSKQSNDNTSQLKEALLKDEMLIQELKHQIEMLLNKQSQQQNQQSQVPLNESS